MRLKYHCPRCGQKMVTQDRMGEMATCPSCLLNHAIPNEAVEDSGGEKVEQGGVLVCSICKEPTMKESTFCYKCGSKFAEQSLPHSESTSEPASTTKRVSPVALGCLVIGLIATAITVIFVASGGRHEPSTDVAQRNEKVKEIDAELGKHFITYGGGMIEDCKVSSTLGADGKVDFATAKLYFASVPTDFRQSLEYICESLHDVYKSSVLVTAYRRTATGGSWREIGTSEWSLFSSRVTTKVY